MNYLIECFKTAREELLMRVKHRDTWLKTQLYIQALLFAIANGIRVPGIELAEPNNAGLALALPVSCILTCLYFVEDRIIGGLSNYISDLSRKEKELANSNIAIVCWDGSPQFKMYLTKSFGGLAIRFLAQSFAFIGIPAFLLHSYNVLGSHNNEAIWVQWFCGGLILVLVLSGFGNRLKNYLQL